MIEDAIKKGSRPTVPKFYESHEMLFAKLMVQLWDQDPKKRLSFTKIVSKIKKIRKSHRQTQQKREGGGAMAALRSITQKLHN